jgi:hypothetical protein
MKLVVVAAATALVAGMGVGDSENLGPFTVLTKPSSTGRK